MAFKIKLDNGRSLQFRSREAIDTDAAHGTYVIGEVALCEKIDDTEYSTSTGMSFRRDTVPQDVRRDKKIRDKAAKQAKSSENSDD